MQPEPPFAAPGPPLYPGPTVPIEPAAPVSRPPSALVWFAIVGVVVLLAAGLAAVLLLRTSVPGSADELAALLTSPDGRTTSVQVSVNSGPLQARGLAGTGSTDGIRWTATRGWTGGPGQTGLIALSQYDTAEQASVARGEVRRRFLTLIGVRQPVPGHDNAELVVDPAISVLGLTLRRINGSAVQGTMVVTLLSNGETPEFAQAVLADQLDRLP